MRRSLLLFAGSLLALGSAFAQAGDLSLPSSAVTPAAGPFPAQFSSMVRLSLSRDPFYGSQLLHSFDERVAAVAAMREPAQVRDYLQAAAVGPHADAHAINSLKVQLASSSIDPQRASALLLAHALARPGEFGAALDGLETAKPGLGKTAARILALAEGPGDGRLVAALRAAGARRPQSADSIYTRDGRLEALFDGASSGVRDTDAPAAPVDARSYPGYGRDGRPRRSGLRPIARP